MLEENGFFNASELTMFEFRMKIEYIKEKIKKSKANNGK